MAQHARCLALRVVFNVNVCIHTVASEGSSVTALCLSDLTTTVDCLST